MTKSGGGGTASSSATTTAIVSSTVASTTVATSANAGSLSGSDGSGGSPPSCQGLASTCGPAQNEDCCASPLVSGGTYKRSYDGVTYTDGISPATVSDFRLDRFEITVGRFRAFVNAFDATLVR